MVKNKLKPLILGILLTLSTHLHATDVIPVKAVELQRYIGVWHEICRIPNPYQKQCIGNCVAEYRLRPDGLLDIINSCDVAADKRTQAKGIAKMSDPSCNAKLEVSFANILGLWLFWGPYWIIGLDPNYQYTVIGDPTHKFGWVLSREKTLTPTQIAEVTKILVEQGYDPAKFEPGLK